MTVQHLKNWFLEQKRDLPWRDNPTPYMVWISEVMLQQTQVVVVVPYFLRWMQKFPTLPHLAEASIEEVVKAWEGLGYYSRARNLHKAAQRVMLHYNGELPTTAEELRALPGFGPYTVGAVLSFAFHQKAAAVDGNVVRVISRYFATHRDIQQKTETILPDHEPWVIMEAIIELGAQVCQKKPKCLLCPLRPGCLAFQNQQTDLYPLKKERPQTVHLKRHVAVVLFGEEVLVRKGEPGKVMEGLYEFPYFDLSEKSPFDFPLVTIKKMGPIKHGFTKYEVTLYPVVYQVKKKHSVAGFEWKNRNEMSKLPFSSGHKEYWRQSTLNILHTESSNGWGGQEIRILKESMGMRERGHAVILAVVRGGKLAEQARKHGFTVYEINFKKSLVVPTIFHLMTIMRRHSIDVVNTHSSLDAWLGAIAARLSGRKVVRTRHLSTPIRGGLNAKLLYGALADFIVTTSSGIIPKIAEQAHIPIARLKCIPTGVEPFEVSPADVQAFRAKYGIKETDILVGTVCVVRSWKGIQDLIAAAKQLKHIPHLKWVVVGGGYIDHFTPLVDPTIPLVFTGHLESPFAALAALDIFALLSTAHEGISQASLQAAFLEKPLVTTTIGGLPEVCINEVTGLLVPPSSPTHVANAIMRLASDPLLRKKLGQAAKELVHKNLTFENTIDQMEHIFSSRD